MNIEDAIGKRRDEIGREETHVSGEADEIDSLSCRAATTRRSYASRSSPLEGMTRVGRPRPLARSIPAAPSRLLRTRAISALGMRPESTLSAKATKLDPRPLRRTPMRLFMRGKR